MAFLSYDDDAYLAADARDVLTASAVLEITEFHLFELAYARWFGEPAAEHQIEPFFVTYMFRSVAPLWVRQFCREVLSLDADGRLVPEDFGVRETPGSATMFARGVRYTIAAVLVLASLHVIAILVSSYVPLT